MSNTSFVVLLALAVAYIMGMTGLIGLFSVTGEPRKKALPWLLLALLGATIIVTVVIFAIIAGLMER